MKCQEKGCGGEVEISPNKAVPLQAGSSSDCDGSCVKVYLCNRCGSLHYDDGSSVATRTGANVSLEDRKVEV